MARIDLTRRIDSADWAIGVSAALPLIPRWTKTPHKELGLSLFLYHMARIDLTRRIDSADWAIGVSAARFAFD
jgi:hypothetical protein